MSIKHRPERSYGRPLRTVGRALALGLLLGACSGLERSPPRDRVEEKTERYTVAGSTAQDLRWSLERFGPVGADGRRSPAVTRWNFEYTFGVAPSAGGCRLDSLETTTIVTTVLPRWSPGPEAPRELVKRWEDYVTCVALHETGHKRIYLDAVEEFRRLTAGLGTYTDCEAAGSALDALAQRTYRDLQRAQEGYESRTDHGYAQCGHFP